MADDEKPFWQNADGIDPAGNAMPHKRFIVIDVWVSLLLCFVLLGHCSFPNAPGWYANEVHTWIYSFHMAAFYFVCGFLVAHSYRPLTDARSYFSYIGRKVVKFGTPFLGFGITLCIYHAFVEKGGGLELLKADLQTLFLNPITSPSGYLWFIYLLLEFYLVAPVFCQFYSWTILPGGMTAILLCWRPLPSCLCLQLLSRYLLFFLLGVVARKHLAGLASVAGKRWGVSILSCAPPLWLASIILFAEKHPLVPALLSLPALYLIARELSKNKRLAIFCEFLSRRCFAIYLWQMIFIQLLALILFRFCHLPHWCLLMSVIPVGIAVSLLADWAWNAARRRMQSAFLKTT